MAQGGKETVEQRLLRVLPHAHDKLFVWYGEGARGDGRAHGNSASLLHGINDTISALNLEYGSNRAQMFHTLWGAITNQNPKKFNGGGGQYGAHFVVGRERIRAYPLRLYEELLLFATGQKFYPGSQFWYDSNDRKYAWGPGISCLEDFF